MTTTRALAVDPPEEALSPAEAAAMSLEDLMSLNVTSVAGVGTGLFSTPAAITSISADDIRRSGFRTLAESLRLAPGVFVGRTVSHQFSVGTRGFNGSLANKTLVLIDGRAVYDPLFGGTFWDVQDTLLEDIDRIEVVRGPGATLWGANAVNGVINVSTKSARDTQGLLLAGGGGTYEQAFGEGRYGFQLGDHSWARVYGKWFQRDSIMTRSGGDAHDDWDMLRGGFRFDHQEDDGLTFTLQGDVYHSDTMGELMVAPVPGQSLQFVTDIRDYHRNGANVIARLSREEADQGWSLQAYYDRTERTTNISFRVNRDTFDLDWRHHVELGERHQFVWGLSSRYTHDRVNDGYSLLFDPNEASFFTLSAFVQDTITLVPDSLFAMLGSKLSFNNYTDVEVQPSARLWWTPDDSTTLWASISRPVRVPSRTEEQGSIAFGYIDAGVLAGGAPTGVIVPLGISPNNHLEAEELLAYELGYRVRLGPAMTLDTSLYYNDYTRLIYVRTGLDPFNNSSTAQTYGGEFSLTWQAASNWRLTAGYSYTQVQIHGTAAPTDEGNTPHHQAQLRSNLDITSDLELNTNLYYVDEVPQVRADPYWRLDVGVTWRVTDNFELAIWGQDLLESAHREFSTSEVGRGVYVMGTLRF